MHRNIIWFYVTALTLLDFTLNGKLSAYGSHDVSHDSLVPDGISFQEWESWEAGAEARQWLFARPRSLALGRVPLGAAHARSVTLHNRGNATLHLASVAGTTPDFHASFFHSKSIPAGGNTSFSVVYLGRRAGPASALLYLHTSRGLHKYHVSAIGEPSPWCAAPLAGLRAGAGAGARLTRDVLLCNPTDQPVQIVEAYSSAAWCEVLAPGAGEGGAGWLLPPRGAARPLRLRLSSPAPRAAPATAYLRIKLNASMSGAGGAAAGAGGTSLTLRVEAGAARTLELPSLLDLATRGHHDPPHTEVIEGGNPSGEEVVLQGSLCGLRCYSEDVASDPAHSHHANGASSAEAGGGAGAGTEESCVAPRGVSLRVLKTRVPAAAPPSPLLELAFNWTEVWLGAVSGAGAGAGAGGVWRCEGGVKLGGAGGGDSLQYSVRLLRGTLRADHTHLHIVTGSCDAGAGGSTRAGGGARRVSVRSEFSEPLHVLGIVYPPDLHTYFSISSFTPAVVSPGATWLGPTLSLLPDRCGLTYNATILLLTNVTAYPLSVCLYTGALSWEFDWVGYSDNLLDMGAVPLGGQLLIRGALVNNAPAEQVVLEVSADSPLVLLPPPFTFTDRVIRAGGRIAVTLSVDAASGAGKGSVRVRSAHAATSLRVLYTSTTGNLLLKPVHLQGALGSAALVAESSLRGDTLARGVALRGDLPYTLRLAFACEGGADEAGGTEGVAGAGGERRWAAPPRCLLSRGSATVATLHYAHNLHTDTGDMARLLSDLSDVSRDLTADAALLQRRHDSSPLHALYNFTIILYTTEVLQVSAAGTAMYDWPTLTSSQNADGASIGSIGGGALGQGVSQMIQVTNPSPIDTMLLQPVLHHYHPINDFAFRHLRPGGEVAGAGAGAEDVSAFSVSVGPPAPAPPAHNAAPLLLPPGAALTLNLTLLPQRLGDYHAFLYLRNNVSVVEALWLRGAGVVPRLVVAGLGAGGLADLGTVTNCAGAARELRVWNAGVVSLALPAPALWGGAGGRGGGRCAARGFSVQPCRAALLQPRQTMVYTITYANEWGPTTAYTDFYLPHAPKITLRVQIPPAIFTKCAQNLPKLPNEQIYRTIGLVIAFVVCAMSITAGAMDAEAILKRTLAVMREVRDRDVPKMQLLDLRAIAKNTMLSTPTVSSSGVASTFARQKRKLKKLVSEVKGEVTRGRGERQRLSEEWDTPPLDDDCSRSSNDDIGDDLIDKHDYCDKFDKRRDRFDNREFDKYDSREKFEYHRDKFDGRSDKYDSRSDKVESRNSKFDSRSDKFDIRGDSHHEKSDNSRDKSDSPNDKFIDRRMYKFETRSDRHDIRSDKQEIRSDKHVSRSEKHESQSEKYDGLREKSSRQEKSDTHHTKTSQYHCDKYDSTSDKSVSQSNKNSSESDKGSRHEKSSDNDRYRSQNDKYVADNDKYQPDKRSDEKCRHRDKLSSEDKYSPDNDKFGSQNDKHRHNSKYESHTEKATSHEKQDKYSRNNDRYSAGDDKYTRAERYPSGEKYTSGEKYSVSGEKGSDSEAEAEATRTRSPSEDDESSGTESSGGRRNRNPATHTDKNGESSERYSGRRGTGANGRASGRRESAPAPPPRRAPAPAPPALPNAKYTRVKVRGSSRRGRGEGPASPAPAPAAPPAPPAPPELRATFSEVVSSGAGTGCTVGVVGAVAAARPPSSPPAPTRPAPPPPVTAPHTAHVAHVAPVQPPQQDSSLFYYSSNVPGRSWSESPPAPAPAPPTTIHSDVFTHAHDRHYNDESVSTADYMCRWGGGGGGAGGARWWGGPHWAEGAPAPPPGFPAAPPPAPGPIGTGAPRNNHGEGAAGRVFDPFQALSGVWPGGAAWTSRRDTQQ